MSGGIGRKVAGFQSTRKSQSLTERNGKTVTGNGVHGPGSVSGEGDISPMDFPQRHVSGERSFLRVGGISALQMGSQFGELLQNLIPPNPRIARKESDANFLMAQGGCISLTVLAPVNLGVVAP